jgi:hypothetical protein
MQKLIPIILILLFTQCASPSKDKVKGAEESKTIQSNVEEGKSSAELMMDSEATLLHKREVIDQLIDTLGVLYTKEYGKKDAAERMVFLRESQELFVKYKDAMRDVYCFDADDIGSGWSQNEFIYNYVITLSDARIKQLEYLKEDVLEKH